MRSSYCVDPCLPLFIGQGVAWAAVCLIPESSSCSLSTFKRPDSLLRTSLYRIYQMPFERASGGRAEHQGSMTHTYG